MLRYAYKYENVIKTGIFNSDNEDELKSCIPTGSVFWNLNKISIENINDTNYSGIGNSDLNLKVEKDEKNY